MYCNLNYLVETKLMEYEELLQKDPQNSIPIDEAVLGTMVG